MGWGSVQSGPLKLVEDNEALVVVGVVGHGHGNCGRWEASEIRVAYEGGDPFSLKGNTEALCERNTRRAEDCLHSPDGGLRCLTDRAEAAARCRKIHSLIYARRQLQALVRQPAC